MKPVKMFGVVSRYVGRYCAGTQCKITTHGLSTETNQFATKDHADLYAQFRPTYPAQLYSDLLRYCNETTSSLKLATVAVDVGCGQGQVADELAKKFGTVYGYDQSQAQIDGYRRLLTPGTNIEVGVHAAEDMSALEDRSVDLITCAQALHWLNLPAFYSEALRVLKPGGVLAYWGYRMGRITSSTEADDVLQAMFERELGPYWDPRRRLLDAGLEGLHPASASIESDETRSTDFTVGPDCRWVDLSDGGVLPQSAVSHRDATGAKVAGFRDVGRVDGHFIQQQLSAAGLIGYMQSWSAYHEMLQVSGISKGHVELDPIARVTARLYELGSASPFRMKWPLVVVFARKPTGID